MNTNQNFIIAVVVAVALIVGGGLFFLGRPATTPPTTTEQSKSTYIVPSPTESAMNLESSQKELESTDIDTSVDAQLTQLDTDSSTF